MLIPMVSLASTTIQTVTGEPLMATLGNAISCTFADEYWKHFLAEFAKQTAKKWGC